MGLDIDWKAGRANGTNKATRLTRDAWPFCLEFFYFYFIVIVVVVVVVVVESPGIKNYCKFLRSTFLNESFDADLTFYAFFQETLLSVSVVHNLYSAEIPNRCYALSSSVNTISEAFLSVLSVYFLIDSTSRVGLLQFTGMRAGAKLQRLRRC